MACTSLGLFSCRVECFCFFPHSRRGKRCTATRNLRKGKRSTVALLPDLRLRWLTDALLPAASKKTQGPFGPASRSRQRPWQQKVLLSQGNHHGSRKGSAAMQKLGQNNVFHCKSWVPTERRRSVRASTALRVSWSQDTMLKERADVNGHEKMPSGRTAL